MHVYILNKYRYYIYMHAYAATYINYSCMLTYIHIHRIGVWIP